MSKELVEAIAKALCPSVQACCGECPGVVCVARGVLSSIERVRYKVVPVEPTEEMLEGGREWALGGSTFAAKRCWPAMLAAAPKQV